MGVPESGGGVQDREKVDRIEREVGDTVVLEGDVDGRHLGVGRSRQTERRVQDWHGAEHRQTFEESAIGAVGVADQNKVDIGLIPRGQPAQLKLDNAGHRGALGVTEYHDRAIRTRVVVADEVAGQLGDATGHRLIKFGATESAPALPRERPELGKIGHRFGRAHDRARCRRRADVVVDGVAHVAGYCCRVRHCSTGHYQCRRSEGDRCGDGATDGRDDRTQTRRQGEHHESGQGCDDKPHAYASWHGCGLLTVEVDQRRSMIVTFAVPPPSHIVCSPYRPPVRSSSHSMVANNLAPVAPSG